MYTYPEYLNACQRVALDLLDRAHKADPVKFPFPLKRITLTVAADSRTGTASVDWRVSKMWGMHDRPEMDHLYVTINMPVKAATYMVTEAEFQHGIAYLLHEVGHPLHTDKATWDAAVARRAQNLLNSLEDVREEKATIDLGLAVNATLMFGGLIDSLHAKAVANGYDPNNLRSIGWTLSLMGRKANGYDMDTSDVAAKLDPKGAVAAIMAWALPDLAACQSTQACLDLADKVTAAVRAATPKPPKPEPQPDQPEIEIDLPPSEDDEPVDDEPLFPENEEDPDENPYEDDRETEFEGQGVNKPETDENASQEGGDTPSRRNDLNDEDKPEPQPEPEVPSDDLIDDVDMTPNKNEVVTSSSQSYSAVREINRQVRKALDRKFEDKPVVGRTMCVWGRTTIEAVTGDASKMGRQRSLLAAALKREETDDFEGGRTSGRLNRRALSKLTTGNPHIFGKRILAEGYDTDVQILIDGSSSMSNARILAAATLGLVVSQAAAQVGVNCTAHVFNDNGLHAITKGRAKPIGKKFAYAYNQIMGCTPLTQNLLDCAFEQKRRAPNKRRVLFVITDGGCDMGPDVLKSAGLYIEQIVGAEIANLHIGYRPMGVFRNECAVNVDNVPASGLQTLTSTLERGAR